VAIASIFLLAVRAGTTVNNAIEPEDGTVSSTSLIASDATASNGGYYLFNGCDEENAYIRLFMKGLWDLIMCTPVH
jgi:hypothetical protein